MSPADLADRLAEANTFACPGLHYDTLFFKMPACSLADRTLLLAQPCGYQASAWTEKHVPVSYELSHAALKSVSKSYHKLTFDGGLKSLVRHGIPPSMRPTLWHFLSGGYALQLAAPEGLFNTLSASIDNIDDATINSIEGGSDTLCETYRGQAFEDNLVLKTGKGSEALTHVMYALLQHCKDLKYSRALHHLAAFLTVVFGAHRAEHAFWTLAGLIQSKLFPYVNGEVTNGNFVEKGVLELLVQRKLPKLSAHIAKMGWTLAAITHGWFSTVFTSNVQPEVAARIWDSIMCEGNKVMHRVALALLKRFESTLSTASDEEMVRRVLEVKLLEISDKEGLMRAAFNGVGSMPGALLKTFRDQVLEGAAYASFKELNATNDMHFEASPEFTVMSVLQPAVGLKGLLGRGVSRRSHGSDDGVDFYSRLLTADHHEATDDASSQAGYYSDGHEGSEGAARPKKKKNLKERRLMHVHWVEDDVSSPAAAEPPACVDDVGPACPELACPDPACPELALFARVSYIDVAAAESETGHSPEATAAVAAALIAAEESAGSGLSAGVAAH